MTASIQCSRRVSRKPKPRESSYRFQMMMGGGALWPTITMKTSESTVLFLKCGVWMEPFHSMQSTDSFNFFAPFGQPKFWVKKGAHPFGYFFFYVLDKAICPFLAETLRLPLLHPTTPEQVDKLLTTTVDV